MAQIMEHTWLLGEMQIIRKVGNRWGLSKHSIDMMNKLNVIVKNKTRGPIIMVLLN